MMVERQSSSISIGTEFINTYIETGEGKKKKKKSVD